MAQRAPRDDSERRGFHVATGIGILYSFAKVVPEASIFVVQLSHWITAFFSMTFATNLICTGASLVPHIGPLFTADGGPDSSALVAYRIYFINRKHLSFRHRKLRPVMVLIVESGAFYSATLLALLILYNVDSWFQYVVLDAVSPIVVSVRSRAILRYRLPLLTGDARQGIVCSVIILRIATGMSGVEGETALLEPSGGVQLSRMSSRGDRKDSSTGDEGV